MDIPGLDPEEEDLALITEPRLRKRVQNRLSQRKHRRKSREQSATAPYFYNNSGTFDTDAFRDFPPQSHAEIQRDSTQYQQSLLPANYSDQQRFESTTDDLLNEWMSNSLGAEVLEIADLISQFSDGSPRDSLWPTHAGPQTTQPPNSQYLETTTKAGSFPQMPRAITPVRASVQEQMPESVSRDNRQATTQWRSVLAQQPLTSMQGCQGTLSNTLSTTSITPAVNASQTIGSTQTSPCQFIGTPSVGTSQNLASAVNGSQTGWNPNTRPCSRCGCRNAGHFSPQQTIQTNDHSASALPPLSFLPPSAHVVNSSNSNVILTSEYAIDLARLPPPINHSSSSLNTWSNCCSQNGHSHGEFRYERVVVVYMPHPNTN